MTDNIAKALKQIKRFGYTGATVRYYLPYITGYASSLPELRNPVCINDEYNKRIAEVASRYTAEYGHTIGYSSFHAKFYVDLGNGNHIYSAESI